eukprot:scaffold13555_cov38-Cyclotella_meneghiniana.AAC.3
MQSPLTFPSPQKITAPDNKKPNVIPPDCAAKSKQKDKCNVLVSNKTKIDVASHPKQQPYACQVFRVDGRHHTLDAATVNWRG